MVSSDYVSDDAAGDALAAKLHEELTSASGPVERKAEVIMYSRERRCTRLLA